LFNPPHHPYTEALSSAIPVIEKGAKKGHIQLKVEIPVATSRPVGCPFHTRCPRSLGEVCAQKPPPWQMSERGDRIYCHIPLADLAASQLSMMSPTDRASQ